MSGRRRITVKILVTGIAGFIGHAVARRLSGQGHQIVGIDNLNDYYDVSLKQARLDNLAECPDVQFLQLELADREAVAALFREIVFDRVIHLAAQAGVRYSLENPHVYADSNLIGHLNILEGCRYQQVGHLIYASSSSVYGMNAKAPFTTSDCVDHPVSLYAATKKANELMSHTYAHLYDIPVTGLRFFTVYGPWGRPDMAIFKFVKAMFEGKPIQVYNHGEMSRDFTYIDDIVEGIVRLINVIPQPSAEAAIFGAGPGYGTAPYALYNIGYGAPVSLMAFIRAIEAATGKEAACEYLPMQPGDVPRTWADTQALLQATGYQPKVHVEEGVRRFVKWYRGFYNV